MSYTLHTAVDLLRRVVLDHSPPQDLTREELRAGLDASLPTFAGCLAMDCRKANDTNVGRLKEVWKLYTEVAQNKEKMFPPGKKVRENLFVL